MLKETIVLAASICYVLAAVAIAPLDPKPKKYENVTGCYIKDMDIFIPLNGTAPSNSSCMQYRCKKSYVLYESCGAVAVEPPCYIVQDESQPYPGCCPMGRCNDETQC